MSAVNNTTHVDHGAMVDIEGREFTYFGSGAGVYELSNFTECKQPFPYGGFTWTTSEHAYQATKFAAADWPRFAEGGDLSTLAGMRKVVDTYSNALKRVTLTILARPNSDPLKQKLLDQLAVQSAKVKKKEQHWSKNTKRPAMTGIVAKMASNPKRATKMGLTIVSWTETDEDALSNVFRPILRAKYRHNPDLTAALLGTGDALLVEFDRGAVRATNAGRGPLWTGQVKNGVLYGRNLMGRLQMEMRELARSDAL
jgi:predicted NAD-dependent protein-ADP-ribosyltransferase YbiA (DUF1768 family)